MKQLEGKLSKEVQRKNRIKRWKRATKLIAKNSEKVNKEFQSHSMLKKCSERSSS